MRPADWSEQIANFMDGISVPLFFVTLAVVAAPLALVHELGHAFMAVLRLPGKVIVRVGGDNPTATFDSRPDHCSIPSDRSSLALRRRLFVFDTADPCTVLIVLAGPTASIAAGLLAFGCTIPVCAHLRDGPRQVLACRRAGGTGRGLPVPCPDDPDRYPRRQDANRRCPRRMHRAIRPRPTYVPRQWIKPTPVPPASEPQDQDS